MKPEYIIGIILLLSLAGGAAYLSTRPGAMNEMPTLGLSVEKYKEIADPSGFVNTGVAKDGSDEPISIKEFVGKKVILVDFLTYSCINCQRTFPYMNAWYETYKDKGLVIIGIHTPEFAFEGDIDNVRAAMQKFGIKYPIVLDNKYATWRAYGNQYWPRKYLIDIHGNIVYDHIGEGGYEETEAKIRELLDERARVLGQAVDVGGPLAAEAVPVVSIAAQSPETYFGSQRNEFLANGDAGKAGQHTFTLPQTFSTNALYLGGVWNIEREYAESVSDASVVYRYRAREVYVVAQSDEGADIEVRQDGAPVGDARGADVEGTGLMHVKESRLYVLIHNNNAGEHTIELKIKKGKVKMFTLTFG